MILVAFVFLYLAIKRLRTAPSGSDCVWHAAWNIYPDIMANPADTSNGVGGMLYYFYTLDKMVDPAVPDFMGVGAMTDFSPLIANRSAS